MSSFVICFVTYTEKMSADYFKTQASIEEHQLKDYKDLMVIKVQRFFYDFIPVSRTKILRPVLLSFWQKRFF